MITNVNRFAPEAFGSCNAHVAGSASGALAAWISNPRRRKTLSKAGEIRGGGAATTYCDEGVAATTSTAARE